MPIPVNGIIPRPCADMNFSQSVVSDKYNEFLFSMIFCVIYLLIRNKISVASIFPIARQGRVIFS